MIVCLTPVRNEAWILERFLAAALTWADFVVVADQGSTDGSREIAARFERVSVIDNNEAAYDEAGRQRLLLAAGRGVAGGRPVAFFALDADEALTADLPGSTAWGMALRSPPGSAIDLRWANVLPGGKQAWLPATEIQFGLIDDGTEHRGTAIHSRRLPRPLTAPTVRLETSRVLHLQYLDWERMLAKQRFYQSWERVHNPSKRPAQIFRQYHHWSAIPLDAVHALPSEWIAGYRREGIDLLAVAAEPAYETDGRVMDFVQEYGVAPFRKLDMWNVDWPERARAMSRDLPRGMECDPRRPHEHAVHRWLARTQSAAHRPSVRAAQVALRAIGW